MTNETGVLLENTDGVPIETDTESKEPVHSDTDSKVTANKPRSVSFNRDVHIKRFGKSRDLRASSAEPTLRKEPFTHLSKEELIEEANKVRAQAERVTCTADHPPEKFFSLPHRKKLREDRDKERRNSDDSTPEGKTKSPLGRSTSDVSPKRKERTSLSTLFRRAQKNKAPIPPVVVTSPAEKPNPIVKRSKSDVSDLKSNTNLNDQTKPIRKRSGSETEEFLKSLRNKKTQLSPIIESSPREDYFRKTPPLDVFQKQKLAQKDSNKSEEVTLASDSKKVNPVEKPPRYKAPEKSEPKPPVRTKRAKSSEKESQITETPKRQTDIKKTLLVDEIDTFKAKDPIEVKSKIKDSIRKIEDNVYGSKDMIHSSQKPPDKPPLTRGHTVDPIVRILNDDQSPPPPPHLISPTNKTNVNQPFSYTKPSVSPDPNLFVRNTSPDRVPTPVNAMNDKGVVYAHVVRENGDTGSSNLGKQTIHKTYSPSRERYGNISDEDEGLGYEERHKYANKFDYDYKNNDSDNFNSLEGPKIIDSPIRPRFREYKLTSFNDFEPTYANDYPSGKDKSPDLIETFRGRADGMDNKKIFEADVDFNELSHRRQLLESRINTRKPERERIIGEPISRYLAETDPIYEADKRMKATEKYVNETARYIHNTLERDGYTESSITEDYNRYDAHDHKMKYNTESRAYHKSKREIDRREYIDSLEPRYKDDKFFPPEPEYEPPNLEFNTGKPILSPDEYKEKKYKVKKHFTSSHDVTQSGPKYKGRDDSFGKRKGHYASNPEIAQEREDEYANIRYNAKQAETYHNSLRRVRNKDKYKEDYGIRRHDSGDSRDYYRDDRSPRRFDIDNRLVDSGIENDFRKDSSGEIHRKYHRHGSDDDVRNTSLFLVNERRHTEDNYPSEQIYANGEYLTKFKGYRDDGYRKEYSKERGDEYDPTMDRYDKSPNDDKVSAKPPKAKKLSGLEKVKQLFSRDSSKKSKKEKEAVQQKARTRVLKSPEHLAHDDSEYRRYTDPEPSDIEVKKKYYETAEERKYKSSREDLDRQRSSREDLDHPRSSKESLDRHRSRNEISRHMSPREDEKYRGSKESVDKYRSSREDVRYKSPDPRDSDVERKYRERDLESQNRTLKKERRYTERKEDVRRYNSSDKDSDLVRSSDVESDRRKTRSRTAGPLDSPALAERYRERRRLATPSPTPSPPRRQPAIPPTSSGNWFKSLDRFTQKKKKAKDVVVEKASVLTNEDDRKAWSKSKNLNSPAKNLRFFGDTDMESDCNTKPAVTKTRSHPQTKTHSGHSTLKKTASNSSTGIDEIDHQMKSYSLTNLQEKQDSPRSKYFKRNLQNISEIHSNSENESNISKRASKPPISPYDRRSRSQSTSKTLKGSKGDLRKRNDERGSSSELRNSKQELRDLKHRRRTPAHNSGGSSTEGESSHQSQRSVVYLHATTVGDIPDPGHLSRNRSRDDVSSVNSSNLQVRSTAKSFSIFAPWAPRHYPGHQDVHYTTNPRRTKTRDVKTSSRNTAEHDRTPTPLQKKSYSQSTLTRKPQSTNHRLTSSNTSLYKKPERKENSSVLNSTLSRKSVVRDKKSQSNEVLNRESRSISRSLSMPKDKKAGWFKLSNKKKTENSRVR